MAFLHAFFLQSVLGFSASDKFFTGDAVEGVWFFTLFLLDFDALVLLLHAQVSFIHILFPGSPSWQQSLTISLHLPKKALRPLNTLTQSFPLPILPFLYLSFLVLLPPFFLLRSVSSSFLYFFLILSLLHSDLTLYILSCAHIFHALFE